MNNKLNKILNISILFILIITANQTIIGMERELKPTTYPAYLETLPEEIYKEIILSIIDRADSPGQAILMAFNLAHTKKREAQLITKFFKDEDFKKNFINKIEKKFLTDPVNNPVEKEILNQVEFLITNFLSTFRTPKYKRIHLNNLLFKAARESKPEQVQLLLDFGAEVSSREPIFVDKADLETKEKQGFDLQQLNGQAFYISYSKDNPLIQAIEATKGTAIENQKYYNILDILSKKLKKLYDQVLLKPSYDFRERLKQIKEQKSNALLRAAQYGDMKATLISIKNRFDTNSADSTGKTPLMIAAQNGHAETVNVLINAGADINKTDNLGQTALILAAISGNLQTVEKLLESNADVYKTDKNGRNALYYAETKGRQAIATTAIKEKMTRLSRMLRYLSY